MSQLNVLHRVQLNVGSIPLSFSNSALSLDTSTAFVMGTQKVGSAAEFVGGDTSGTARTDFSDTGKNCLLLIRNDAASSTATADELLVALNGSTFNIIIKPQFCNLISVDDPLTVVKAKSGGNNISFTYAVVQLEAE